MATLPQDGQTNWGTALNTWLLTEHNEDGTHNFTANDSSLLGAERLTQDLTLYVATDGNDSNDGRTSGTAFLTLQRAFDVASRIDSADSQITIQMADGTYVGNARYLSNLKSKRTIILQGNQSNPDAVILNGTLVGYTLTFDGGKFNIKNLKIQRSDATAAALVAIDSAYVSLDNVHIEGVNTSNTSTDFYPSGISAESASTIDIINLKVSGYYWQVFGSGSSANISMSGGAVCHYNNPTIEARVININQSGRFSIYSNAVFTGSVSGTSLKYRVYWGAILYCSPSTNYSNPANFPGNTAGEVFQGGQVY